MASTRAVGRAIAGCSKPPATWLQASTATIYAHRYDAAVPLFVVSLLVVANPCFGLDVKAVAEVRARLMAARNAGCAILLISEDLDEILELADRIVVMRRGRVVHEAPAAGADPHAIGAHMLDAQAVSGARTEPSPAMA